MADKKRSDTLEQRRKAQEEFIKLKKMQSGEIEPEKKPSEVAVLPSTPKEKLKNFWYHYKIHTFIVLFLCFVLVIGVTHCARREEYDAKIVLYTNNYYHDAHMDTLAEYMTQYFTDINGDGKVLVQVINCSYSTQGTYDSEYTQSLSTKLNSVLSGDTAVQLFIVDEKNFRHLNTVFDTVDEFFVDSTPLPDDLYKVFKKNELELPENLIIGQRVVKGTSMEGEKNIDRYVKSASDALKKIKDRSTATN